MTNETCGVEFAFTKRVRRGCEEGAKRVRRGYEEAVQAPGLLIILHAWAMHR